MSNHHHRHNEHDTNPGDILWLHEPPSSEDSSLRVPLSREQIFNHPVMIWSIKASEKSAWVLVLTSLGKRDLKDRHSNNRIVRAAHLPIHPAPAHPDTNELLYLQSDLQLPNKSYIGTKKRHLVPLTLIEFGYRERPSGKKYKLRRDSYLKVVRAVDADLPMQRPLAVLETPSVLHDTFLADYSRSDRYLPPTNNAASYGSIGDYTNQSRHLRLDAAPAESVVCVIPKQQPKRPRPDATIVPCFPNRHFANTQSSINNNNRLPVPHRPATLPLPVTTSTSTPASTASLYPCLIVSFTFLFLAFFLYMAYWISKARM